ncbi:MAG: ribbon-helix-helix domain-containing protein [Methylococcaceae bacterium]|nr:ribbon-helix-helix domain-containing protein [Methylococcaceae bacterium]
MKSVRITVSIPEPQHKQIQQLAEENNLSVAWVVRQAVSHFLEKNGDVQAFSPLSKQNNEGRD